MKYKKNVFRRGKKINFSQWSGITIWLVIRIFLHNTARAKKTAVFSYETWLSENTAKCTSSTKKHRVFLFFSKKSFVFLKERKTLCFV
jgi:hypothetical protein